MGCCWRCAAADNGNLVLFCDGSWRSLWEPHGPPSFAAQPTHSGRDAGSGWAFRGVDVAGKVEIKRRGSPRVHACVCCFMGGKRIDDGRAAELTDCMKDRLMGKELHGAVKLSRQGNPRGRIRERKNNPGSKMEKVLLSSED